MSQRTNPTRAKAEALDVRPLSEAMRERLYELGQQQLDAAKIIGVPKQAFNDWLHGKRSPMAKYAPKLAKWLGVSMPELMQMIALRMSPTEMAEMLSRVATLAEANAEHAKRLEARLRKLDQRVRALEDDA